LKGSTNFTAEAQRSQSRSFLLPFGGIFPPNKNFPPRALGVCGENLRQSEMRKLMFGLCLVMFLFGLSGCLFVYSQGPDCAVFGVYELHYHVPFYEYPPYPPPVYKPDAYGYWRWHHREWRWEPGV
jgi:hypothetical protein